MSLAKSKKIKVQGYHSFFSKICVTKIIPGQSGKSGKSVTDLRIINSGIHSVGDPYIHTYIHTTYDRVENKTSKKLKVHILFPQYTFFY